MNKNDSSLIQLFLRPSESKEKVGKILYNCSLVFFVYYLFMSFLSNNMFVLELIINNLTYYFIYLLLIKSIFSALLLLTLNKF